MSFHLLLFLKIAPKETLLSKNTEKIIVENIRVL